MIQCQDPDIVRFLESSKTFGMQRDTKMEMIPPESSTNTEEEVNLASLSDLIYIVVKNKIITDREYDSP